MLDVKHNLDMSLTNMLGIAFNALNDSGTWIPRNPSTATQVSGIHSHQQLRLLACR